MTTDKAAEIERASDRPPTSGSDLRPGDVIAERYRIEAVLGQGASGIVHLSRTLEGDKAVALKVIHRELCGDKQIFGRYRREASILRRLNDNHIVGILDFIEHEGLLVIALEYVNGTSLEATLQKPIFVDQSIEVALQIVAGLATAHASGVIHRDLKPANIMIEPRGWPHGRDGDPHVRILDFGLAKVLHGEHMTTGLTEHDMIFGTPEYMAPEQARGDDLDERCDVYAVGTMLYEMVTGSVPFTRRTPLATMTAQLSEPVIAPRACAPTRDISPALEAVILRALEKDREQRYASARELAEALAAAREKRVISIAPRPSGSSRESSPQEMELGETDLAIRLSQVAPERRASLDGRSPSVPTEAPKEALRDIAKHEELTSSRAWAIAMVIVALVAIAAGVLLAMR